MKINPFEGSNPMSWTDAAKVSVILMVSAFFITFLPLNGYLEVEAITVDPLSFFLKAIVFLGTTFFSNFIALAGLAEYMKEKKE